MPQLVPFYSMNFFYNIIDYASLQNSSDLLSCIGIIFLAVMSVVLSTSIPVSSLLDSEADFAARNRQKTPIPTVDLFFLRGAWYGHLLVFNRNDPTGATLDALFMGKGYNTTTHRGMHGICIPVNNRFLVQDPSNTALQAVKLGAFTPVYYGFVATGVTITSHNLPIVTSVTTALDSTNFFIKEN